MILLLCIEGLLRGGAFVLLLSLQFSKRAHWLIYRVCHAVIILRASNRGETLHTWPKLLRSLDHVDQRFIGLRGRRLVTAWVDTSRSRLSLLPRQVNGLVDDTDFG